MHYILLAIAFFLGGFLIKLITGIIKFIETIIIAFILSAILSIGVITAISMGIAHLLDTNFWYVFIPAIIIFAISSGLYLNYCEPDILKKKQMENKNNIKGDSSMGLLKDFAKNVATSDAVKSAVKGAAKEVATSSEVKSAVKDAVKSSIKSSISSVSNNFNGETLDSKNIDKMNAIRYNSSHLSDEQLLAYIDNKSINLYEKIGYAATFADRYPVIK